MLEDDHMCRYAQAPRKIYTWTTLIFDPDIARHGPRHRQTFPDIDSDIDPEHNIHAIIPKFTIYNS